LGSAQDLVLDRTDHRNRPESRVHLSSGRPPTSQVQKTLLGKQYTEAGELEGRKALRDIVGHPSTARFIATKLVGQFVADDPPQSAVSRLERTFIRTKGDLAAVSRELIDLDEAWATPLPKVKTAYELLVSTFRAIGEETMSRGPTLAALRELQQMPFSAPGPDGWPDVAPRWISPESLMRRIEWLRSLAARLPRTLRPTQVFENTVAAIASAETKFAVENAPSGEEALALILVSPEFQRR